MCRPLTWGGDWGAELGQEQDGGPDAVGTAGIDPWTGGFRAQVFVWRLLPTLPCVFLPGWLPSADPALGPRESVQVWATHLTALQPWAWGVNADSGG